MSVHWCIGHPLWRQDWNISDWKARSSVLTSEVSKNRCCQIPPVTLAVWKKRLQLQLHPEEQYRHTNRAVGQEFWCHIDLDCKSASTCEKDNWVSALGSTVPFILVQNSAFHLHIFPLYPFLYCKEVNLHVIGGKDYLDCSRAWRTITLLYPPLREVTNSHYVLT